MHSVGGVLAAAGTRAHPVDLGRGDLVASWMHLSPRNSTGELFG